MLLYKFYTTTRKQKGYFVSVCFLCKQFLIIIRGPGYLIASIVYIAHIVCNFLCGNMLLDEKSSHDFQSIINSPNGTCTKWPGYWRMYGK